MVRCQQPHINSLAIDVWWVEKVSHGMSQRPLWLTRNTKFKAMLNKVLKVDRSIPFFHLTKVTLFHTFVHRQLPLREQNCHVQENLTSIQHIFHTWCGLEVSAGRKYHGPQCFMYGLGFMIACKWNIECVALKWWNAKHNIILLLTYNISHCCRTKMIQHV